MYFSPLRDKPSFLHKCQLEPPNDAFCAFALYQRNEKDSVGIGQV